MKIKKAVLDTSIIIDGKITEMLEKDELEGLEEVIVPLATLDELQAQASKGREPGFLGLDELKKIRKLCEDKKINLRFTGERPSYDDIRLARGGRLDAMIRDVAKSENATLLTADYVQSLVGEAEGVLTGYLPPEVEVKELTFEKYFTPDTMSVHLKEKVVPMAKRGKPGTFKLEKIGDTKLTREELQKMIYEIIERARSDENSFVEVESGGAVVVQMGTYRIAIARPPFSDGFEITLVRPVVKLSLADYKLSQKLMDRLKEKAEGVLIAGPPGSGKCVPSQTPILLNSGDFETAENIFSDNVEYKLSSLNSYGLESKSIVKKYKRLEKTILQIQTNSGRTIELTEEHPVLTIEKGRIKWLPINSFKKNSFIGVPRALPFRGHSNQPLDWINKLSDNVFVEMKNKKTKRISEMRKNNVSIEKIKKIYYKYSNGKSISITPPLVLDKKLSEILGYLWSEGTGGNFEFNNMDATLVNRFKQLMKEVFGINENEFYSPQKGRYRVRKGKVLLDFFEKVFDYPLRRKSQNVDIPDLLLKASQDEIGSFLRAYFDGDGSISKSGIEISTASVKLAEKMCYLFLRLGILPLLRERKINNKIHYRLIISDSQNIRAFYFKIGTLIKGKGFKYFSKKKEHSNVDLIPAGDLLIELYKNLNLPYDQHNLKRNNFTHKSLEKHFNILFEQFIYFSKLKDDAEKLLHYKSIIDNYQKILLDCKSNIKYDKHSTFFRKYRLDHRCINLWLQNKQKPKLSTFLKLLRAVNREYKILEVELENWEDIHANWLGTFKKVYKTICRDSTEIKLSFSQGSFSNMMARKFNVKLSNMSHILDEIISVYNKKINLIENSLANLDILANDFIFWDKIKKIEEKRYNDKVYDFEVEGLHNFIAGYTPFFVHNSTYASSLAEFYIKEKNVVLKTIESPRDLQVGDEVTQYGPLGGDFAKTADILLLVRPDYTIFDEVRIDKHFRIFADMRLSGIGMIGVIHASEAIDAVQRFIGKIELGVIPHVIDTVIFIKDGEIKNVYELSLTVKVPTGMTEDDLARPVVEVRDFESGRLFYEIYSYGEENVVIPVKEERASAVEQLAKQAILDEIRKYDSKAQIQFTSKERVTVRVRNESIPKLIGRDGKNISSIEERLGIHIDVEPKVLTTGKEIDHRLAESGNSLVFMFEKGMKGRMISIYVDDDFLLSATVGKEGEIKISKTSDIGREVLRALVKNRPIKVIAG